MRYFVFALAILLAVCFSHSRNFASIRRDAFTVGSSVSDSAAEYNFISEMAKKMNVPRFRIAVFDNANAGQKLLLEGKVDAIISKVNYSSSFEGRFLTSAPYGKTDVAVAVLASSKTLTLSDLNGKPLAFIPKDVSSEQILGVWRNSKPNAAYNLDDAVGFLHKGTAVAIIANRQSLAARKDSLLRIFPNKILENDIVALFAPGSNELQAEFNKALTIQSPQGGAKGPEKPSNKERIDKMLLQLNELKKELELLKKELK
ncbi:MAG: transporter substrate-binding domain-containing protein [Fibromonadaceae bacterium]|jgi:ABC-type amino acid transport substrate-binding protein|nr:transporter substrate-binding domain-containing protein [Fibromonadaceae bacterium]